MITAGRVSVTTSTATLVYTATGKTRLTLLNHNPGSYMFIGDSGVTYPGGYPLASDVEKTLTLDDGESIYAILDTGGPLALNYLAEN